MSEREVLFRVRETQCNGRHMIDVYPHLRNIFAEEGGHNIILAIAANCVRTLAKREGVEGALDRLTDAVINKSRPLRDKWPWE